MNSETIKHLQIIDDAVTKCVQDAWGALGNTGEPPAMYRRLVFNKMQNHLAWFDDKENFDGKG